MPANGGPAIIKIPARIYPGMFEREVQVTVKIDGEEINLIVPTDSVEMPEAASDEGTKGLLRVEIVQKTSDGFLVDLPGEVQGASSRIEYVMA